MVSRSRLRVGVRRHAATVLCVLTCLLGVTIGSAPMAHAQTDTAYATGGAGFNVGAITNLLSKLAGGSAEPADARTRFVIAVERAVNFQVQALTNPNRVTVDMDAVKLLLPPRPQTPVGVIQDFRGGIAGNGRARVVIDVVEPVVIDRAEAVRNPQTGREEIVLDILPVRAMAARERKIAAMRAKAMGAGITGAGTTGGRAVAVTRTAVQPPLPRVAPKPAELTNSASKPLIVIDPGHGGIDSGAMKWGTQEKDVVLNFGLELRRQLLESGRYRVKMTRETDVFIKLGDRRAFAERHGAALFISVHADYATSSARGATIYSLRESVASRLKRAARSEVKADVLTRGEAAKIASAKADVSMIRRILADLAQRDVDNTRDRTRIFTNNVIRTMSDATRMRRRPDQQAAFKVLKTAKVPSVLIELAFVSNKRDAALLRSKKWRRRVAGSITDAVDNYFSHQVVRLPL